MATQRWAYLLLLVFMHAVRCQGPQIVEDIFPEVKQKGDTAYLNCTVSRQQTSQVHWIQALVTTEKTISINTTINVPNSKINGKIKYEVIRRFGDNDRTTYTLVVNRLRENDSGRYKCMISIPSIGSAQWTYKYGNITVQVPPTIIRSQTSNTVKRPQGSSVSLMCNATGTPTPNITWIRADGKPLPSGRLRHKGHVLNITNIRKDDRGPYRCLADNNVIPPAIHDTHLYVEFIPDAQAVQSTVGQAQNKQLHVILECRISGNPDPTLRWYKVMNSSGKLQILNDGDKYDISQLFLHGTSLQSNDVLYSLKIRNIQSTDYSVYYCEGKNYLGVSRAKVVLYETSQCQGPDCPRETTPAVIFKRRTAIVSNSDGNSVMVSFDIRDPPGRWPSIKYNLRCEDNRGGGVVVNIDIERKDTSWANDTASFSLDRLLPDQLYHCQISSFTALGPGWVDHITFTTTPSDVISQAAGLGSVGFSLLIVAFCSQWC